MTIPSKPKRGSARCGLILNLFFWRGQKPRITDREWVRSKPTRLQFAWFAVLRRVYAFVPWIRKVTVLGFLRWLLLVTTNASIVFLPIIFAKYVAPLMGVAPDKVAEWTSIAVYQTVVLAVLQTVRFLFDAFGRFDKDEKERLERLKEISLSLGQATGVIGAQIERYASTPQADAERDKFLGYALQAIEATVQLCTGRMSERYCCITLLTFEPGNKVLIRARSRVAGRAIGARVEQEKTIAYAVAKYARQSATIQSLKAATKVNKETPLEYRSLSVDEEPPYESILALPLPSVAAAGQNRIRKGVVTIDAELPFEFLGEDTVILPRVQAYLDLINLMLTNHSSGIEPEI